MSQFDQPLMALTLLTTSSCKLDSISLSTRSLRLKLLNTMASSNDPAPVSSMSSVSTNTRFGEYTGTYRYKKSGLKVVLEVSDGKLVMMVLKWKHKEASLPPDNGQALILRKSTVEVGEAREIWKVSTEYAAKFSDKTPTLRKTSL